MNEAEICCEDAVGTISCVAAWMTSYLMREICKRLCFNVLIRQECARLGNGEAGGASCNCTMMYLIMLGVACLGIDKVRFYNLD